MIRAGVLRRAARRTFVFLAPALVVAGAGAAYFFRPIPSAAAPALTALGGDAGEGAYLARLGNCIACHTSPGKPDFAGGLKFETPFGKLYSTNITPDRQNGIGNWTFAQFHAAMKHGQRPDGTNLYPAFPYTSFAKLTDRDIASLFLFFRTVAPAGTANRTNEMAFPFSERRLLHFWKRLFHDDTTYTPEAGKSEEWNRGAYIVEGIAHCGACHSPRNLLGATRNGKALQGGTYMDAVASGAYRKWAAVDLTQGSAGLGQWNAKDITEYLTSGKNAHTIVHGPMKDVIASTRELRAIDAEAIATYLKDLQPTPSRLNLSLLRAGITEGEVVYTVHCGTCHLPDGKGDRILGVPLRKNALIQTKDPSSLINVILYGPDLPPPPFTTGRTTMKPFGKRLSDEDVAALATYLRSSFGNNASAVSPAQVRAQR